MLDKTKEYDIKDIEALPPTSEKETDSTVLDEEGLLKAYVNNSIDKIILSRTGEIEIVKI